MSNKQIIIIGAGPAGEAAAKAVAQKDPDALVTIIEKEAAGGLCLNKGCIPSKTLLEHVHKLPGKNPDVDWPALQKTKQGVVSGIRIALEANLKRHKVALHQGTAIFLGPNEISIETQDKKESIKFDKAIIAAGTESIFPPPLDEYRDQLLDSDRILEITKTPSSILIVGGGAVGCEFACLLNAAGSNVTIVELMEGLLPGEDPAIVQVLERSFTGRGIQIQTKTKVQKLKKESGGWTVELENGVKTRVEQILVCVGRAPKLDAFRLDRAGIQEEKGRLTLNEFLRTTNENVYAAGDVTGRTRLAHAASAQGEVAGRNALGGMEKFDDSLVPRCLYSWPEVASVGRWKWELEKAGEPVKASRGFFKGSSKALAAGDADGFVQVVYHPESDLIYGAQIIGAHATELIHIFSVALHQKMTRKDLANVIFAHPTLSETIKDACLK